ncbi:hypothetical protein X975_16828, partial [Stegodyphus mimosarum]
MHINYVFTSSTLLKHNENSSFTTNCLPIFQHRRHLNTASLFWNCFLGKRLNFFLYVI